MRPNGDKSFARDFDEKGFTILEPFILKFLNKWPSEPDVEDEFEDINAEFLIAKKEFQKILKKQTKSVNSMRKKHQKERASVQKDHCLSISKLTKEVSK
jgi:hypothetical protein